MNYHTLESINVQFRNGILKCLQILYETESSHQIRYHLSESGIKMNDHWNWSHGIAPLNRSASRSGHMWCMIVYSLRQTNSCGRCVVPAAYKYLMIEWISENGSIDETVAIYTAMRLLLQFIFVCRSVWNEHDGSQQKDTHTHTRAQPEPEEKGTCALTRCDYRNYIQRHRIKCSDKLRTGVERIWQVQVFLSGTSRWYANW